MGDFSLKDLVVENFWKREMKMAEKHRMEWNGMGNGMRQSGGRIREWKEKGRNRIKMDWNWMEGMEWMNKKWRWAAGNFLAAAAHILWHIFPSTLAKWAKKPPFGPEALKLGKREEQFYIRVKIKRREGREGSERPAGNLRLTGKRTWKKNIEESENVFNGNGPNELGGENDGKLIEE
jgi:hypothetical protein